MNKPARHHHWVPQCYLKGFARPASKTGQLFAFDFELKKQFPASPRNVGAKRDFNRVDIPGYPIDIVETSMSSFEDEVSKAILEIHRSQQFQDEEQNIVLNLIALLAVRNPRFREQRRSFRQEISEGLWSLVLASPERYQQQIEKAKNAGAINADLNVSYEDAKSFHDEKRYKFEVARETMIKEEFKLHNDVLQALGPRSWTLIFSDRRVGEFITCDHPVMLRSNSLKLGEVASLGFGQRQASVLFPLRKDCFLVGDLEGDANSIKATPDMVAALNTETFLNADRQVYAPSSEFYLFHPSSGELLTGRDLPDIALDEGVR